MKDFIKGRGGKILLASVCILLGLALVTASMGNSYLNSALGFIITPMQQLSAKISGAAADAAPGGKSVEELEAEIKQLTEERDKLIKLTIDYYDIKKNNQQYSKFLELKDKNKEYKFAPGAVISSSSLDLFYGFTLDVGSLAGISKDDPVITDSGLVGWVSEVYPTYCKVTTIFSPDTNVGVLCQRSEDTGVVTGDLKLADQGLVKWKFITAQNKLEAGDIVITTGISGMYPRGIPVGKVKELKNDETDASLYALVEPYVDIKNVRDVFVITEFQGQGNMVILDDDDREDSPSSQPENPSSQVPSSSGSPSDTSAPSSATGD
ncbi:MAG: rod shape-determining protein MreC [Clostridiales bacterium]|nr:rod shape-determining protein MreC [Clostridiales bacterium]